jgi:anti-sigma factor RsiW
MDNHFLLTDDLLWDYADGFLSAEERQLADRYLAQHPEWQARLDMLLAERKALSALPLEKPRPDFTHRVLAAWAVEQVAARPALADSPDWIVRSIGWTFGGMIVLTMVTLFGMALSVTTTAPPSVSLPAWSIDAWQDALSNPIWGYSLVVLSAIALLLFIDRYRQYRQVVTASA